VAEAVVLDFVNPVRPGRHGLAEDRLTKCESYVLKESAQPRGWGATARWRSGWRGVKRRRVGTGCKIPTSDAANGSLAL